MEYSQEGANPATIVKINNELASDLGLSVQQIGAALRPFVAGDQISRWLAPDGQNYDVNVQLPKSGRQKVADLAELSVASNKKDADGKPIMVPLRQVVEFVPSTSPQVLKRQALERRVAIYAGVEGRPGGDVDGDVQKVIKTIALPEGVRFDVGGTHAAAYYFATAIMPNAATQHLSEVVVEWTDSSGDAHAGPGDTYHVLSMQ